MKILFLDIDGVICLRESRYLYFHTDSFKRLQNIVTKTDCHIVISSCWRVGKTVKELQDIFSRNGDQHGQYHGPIPQFDVERIIGKTPASGSFPFKDRINGELWGRGLEIDTWLKESKDKFNIEKFIIIDDETSDMGSYKEHCVKTHTETGLTEEIAAEVIRRLS